MIRILLVEDRDIVCKEIKALLTSKPKLQIVGTTGDISRAIKLVAELKPDLVLMNLEIPKLNGIATTEKICQQFPQTKVLVFSISNDRETEYVLQALEASPEGYLLKDTLTQDLEQAIWSIYQDKSQIDSKVLEKISGKNNSENSAKENRVSSIRQLVGTTSFNLVNRTNLNNFKYPYRTLESSEDNYTERSSSKVKPTSFKTVSTDNYHQFLKYLFTRSRNRWSLFFGLLGLLTLCTTVLYGLNFTRRSSNITAESTTETVFTEQVFEGVTALGRIEPSKEVIILSPSPNVGGTRIGELKVSEGEWVQKGQVVALLDNHDVKKAAVEVARQEAELARVNLAIVKAGAKTGDIEAQQAIVNRLKAQSNRETESRLANWQLRQAELANAAAEFSRYQQLAQEGAISQSELDRRRLILATAQQRVKEAQANYNRTRDTLEEEIQKAIASLASIKEVRPLDIRRAKTELNKAIAKLQQAKQDLALTSVKAPIDSKILSINAYPGEMVSPEEGVVELGQTNRMVVIAEVYESDIEQVEVGQQATITSEGGAFSGELQGTVTYIRPQIRKKDIFDTDPAADVDSRVVEVKIRLNSASSKKVALLTNSKVIVAIAPS